MNYDAVSEDTSQYVLFHLGAERYGLPIENIQSIIRYEAPTSVPHAPEGVEGVINLRGQVIPVVDLQCCLLGVVSTPVATTRVIVSESTSGLVGLLVDSVIEVINIAASEIRPAPDVALSAQTADAFVGVTTVDDGLIILLDADKALPHPRLAGHEEA